MHIAENYRRIMDRVGKAAAKAGRDPREIKVLAAAKSQPVEAIRAALAAGVNLIGENYLQEARDKTKLIPEQAEWHMIGHLQRNKAKAAVRLFDLIETLDSVALARELDHEGRAQEKKVRVFIEINLAGEASKSGIAKDKLTDLVNVLCELSHLSVEGLMTVPPYLENPEHVRPFFKELRELKASLVERLTGNTGFKELSMGMTHDYAVAVEEGATIVRIGTALFGPRKS